MEHTYFLKLIAYILFICSFFQNCNSPVTLPLAIKDKGRNQQRDIQSILDKIFTTEEGHGISFYGSSSTLQARVQALDKIYDGIPVNVDEGVKLTEIASLEEKIQQKRIQITFEQEKPISVTVRKAWLLEESRPNEAVIFCGNPGVGKSALCNSIFQEAKFPSGTSRGQGLTTHHQTHMYKNRLYIDTPGLEDINMREQAAAEIEQALKKGGNYKMVFVIVLDDGRLRQADLNAINIICDAIKTPFEYGLVINKSMQETIDIIIEEGGLGPYLITLHKQPFQTIMLTREERMAAKANVYFEVNENRRKLLDLINNLPASNIQLGKIDIRNFEEKIQQMEEKYIKAMAELKAQHKQEREEQEVRITKEREEHEAQVRHQGKEYEAKVKEIQAQMQEQQQAAEIKRKREREEADAQIKTLKKEVEVKQRAAEAQRQKEKEEHDAQIKRLEEQLEEKQRTEEAKMQKDKEEQEVRMKRMQEQLEEKQRAEEAKRQKDKEEQEAKMAEMRRIQQELEMQTLALNAPHKEAIETALAKQQRYCCLNIRPFLKDSGKLNINDVKFLINHPLFKDQGNYPYGEVDLNDIIEADAVVELTKGLRGTRVERLNLISNQIGPAVAAELAKALQGTNVGDVDLSWTLIGDLGAIEFVKGLKGTSVHTVNLSYNKIDDQGAIEFARNLKGTQIYSVDLRANKIGDTGAIELLKSLKDTQVKIVWLIRNKITRETKQLIINQYPHIETYLENVGMVIYE
ncbi:GTPase [Candidatus Amoebophilus asiaticus]|uniref:GTPase n=1 Tax=Candidatus Amoebophilus asiaticus TaxID=281120 RepID=UPI00164F9FF2|nr:GTPase [Candidatus Amoebophilus asiaticus]